MNAQELSFNLNKGDNITKVFLLTETNNDIETPYDMSTSTLRLEIQDNEGNILHTISGTGDNLGQATFTFTSTHTDTVGDYQYKVYEDVGSGDALLLFGDLDIILQSPNSLDSLIDNEVPSIYPLDETYKESRKTYWRLFLQDAADILDADIEDWTKWPTLYNFLIAKLVTYDAMMKEAKKGLMLTAGANGDPNSSNGQIKKVETGPAMVEFAETGLGLSYLFRSSSSGDRPFDVLVQDICGLSNKLGLYLNICPKKKTPIVPGVVGRVSNPDTEVTLLKWYDV